MAFTAKDVMALREMTGAGMMDCKKALTECDGDMEKAKDFLREKGLAAAAKKASRIAAEGVVGAMVTADCGVLAEVNCETDFVAKTDDFKAVVDAVCLQVLKNNPATVEELLDQNYVEDPSKKFSQLITEAVSKIGEKVSVRRFIRFDGAVESYIHLGGKIGVLVEVEPAPADDKAREALFVLFDRKGGEIAIEAETDAAVLVLSGEPIDEPVAMHGPFVMNTREEIRQAMADFQSGRFGRIPA